MKRIFLFLLFPILLFGQTQHDRIKGRGASTFDQYANTATITISGSTPSVASGNVFKTNNLSMTTITNFLGGVDTQQITVICGDGNTTIQNNANIAITGGSNFSCTLNVALSFVFNASSGVWSENGGTGAGGGGSPASPDNSLQKKTAGASTFSSTSLTEVGGVLNVDEDTHLKGPNPYADVTRYGVRSTVINAIPSVPGITATISSGTATATVSTSSCPSQTGSICFVNGDGVMIVGAGATHSITTPSAPTVTPSLPNAAERTPLFVVNGPTGATTYNYKIVARNTAGGLTAASPAGTTTTGASSLGNQSVSIISLSRAAGTNVVSVVTASAHGLAVGAAFRLAGTTSDGLFAGWYNVQTTADNTHFTYITGQWNFGSLPQTATSGSVAWANLNHVTWTNVTGAWEYYIYSDRAVPGTFALIGVSFPVGVTTDNYTWDDYGSPFMDGIKLPPYVPATAPASATANNLVTTISSGAGTTTLTLAANASNSVTNATILFDNAPNLVTAGTANNFGAPLFFPAGGSYVFNSFCDMTGSNNNIIQSGTLVMNETLQIISPIWHGDILPSHTSPASFSWQGAAAISVVNANPGIYVKNGNSSGFWGVQVSLNANAGLGILFDGSPNSVTIQDSTFASGGGTGDYAGIGLMFYGNEASGGAFGLYLSKDTFQASQAVMTSVPLFYCRSCGNGVFRSLSGGGRGLAFSGQSVSAAGPFTFDGAFHFQAGNASLIQSSTASTGQGNGSFYLQNITLDTQVQPMFTSYIQGANGIRITGGAGPAAGIPNISGLPANYITADWSAPTSGQNMNVAHVGGLGIDVTGTLASTIPNPSGGISVAGVAGMGYQFLTPAAPTIVLGNSGSCVSSCVPAGTYFYGIVANDANQGYSFESPVSSSVTTDGTQTITVNWVPVNGQVTTQRYRGTTATNTLSTDSRGTGVTGNSYVDSSSLAYSSSGPTNATGFSEGLSAQGFSGHQFIFTNAGFKDTHVEAGLTSNVTTTWPNVSGIVPKTGELFTNSPREPYNVTFAGALTATWTGETFTIDKPITVTRVQVQLKTAPSGCGTNAVIRLTDGTTPINVTLTAAANDSGALSQNYAAGAILTASVQTAAATCATSPGDANVVVQYRMQ